MEKYSVLMSVYIKETADNLRQSIESMIKQTVPPDELIIVQDGPLGKELNQTIQTFDKLYPGLFKIVRLEQNKGLANALNVGLKETRNELIARMDSDDISLPKRCEMQLRAFEKNPDLSIVGTQINEFEGNPENIISSRQVPTSYKEIKKFARRRSPFNHPSVMYRKSAIESAGGYKDYKRKEDLELFIRMVNMGYEAINLKEAYLLYRTDPANLERRRSWTNCKEYIEIMYGFYRQHMIGITDMIYVVAGQLVIHFAPKKLASKINSIFLRHNPD